MASITGPIRVLVVDDDPAHAEFVSQLIRFDVSPEAQVDVAVSYDAALERFGSRLYDVALLDYMLDRRDGLALLREVRARGDDTPVIVLTGQGAEAVAVAAMKAGAADYIVKASLAGDMLGRSIRHAMQIHAKERERRRAEAALRTSEERFRALVENSSDVLVLLDAGARVTYATPSAFRHFGWRHAEVVGQPLFNFIHPDDLAIARTRFADALKRPGESVAAEVRFRHVDGTYRTMEGVGVNRLHEAAVRGVVVNARDVTERRVLEEQLRQVQKMEAVGRLAGGIAHDFNNLLTAILGYCNLLLEDLPADSPLRADLEEIRSAGDRAASLTRQLLAFSRRQMLQPQPVNLSALVRQTTKTIHRLVGEEIEVRFSLADGLPEVKADPASLEQVVINLAVNARDAMPNGGTLTIATSLGALDETYASIHPSVIPGPYVMLTVSDTGMGMDEATRARVFEPFFTTKEQGKGSGLGLATVYGLVKQSGGYIWVFSEPGQGTIFNVHLPPIVQTSPAEDEPAAGLAPPGAETILLVDDDRAVRGVASEALRRNRYVVLEARNALEALRLVERHQESIDLLVTDLLMPQLNGRELAERLRDARPTLKLLFMSGYADHALVQREIAGGTAFLLKPFTPERLVKMVREVLDVPAARQS